MKSKSVSVFNYCCNSSCTCYDRKINTQRAADKAAIIAQRNEMIKKKK